MGSTFVNFIFLIINFTLYRLRSKYDMYHLDENVMFGATLYFLTVP